MQPHDSQEICWCDRQSLMWCSQHQAQIWDGCDLNVVLMSFKMNLDHPSDHIPWRRTIRWHFALLWEVSLHLQVLEEHDWSIRCSGLPRGSSPTISAPTEAPSASQPGTSQMWMYYQCIGDDRFSVRQTTFWLCGDKLLNVIPAYWSGDMAFFRDCCVVA